MRRAAPDPFALLAVVLAALGAVGGADAAHADDTVVVVPVIVGQSVRTAELDEAVQEAARYRSGVRILSSAAAGIEPAALAACGAEPSCLAAKLAGSRASHALIVLANFMTAQPLVALRLFDAASAQVVASSAAPLAREERGLRNAVRDRARAVFDERAYAPRGRVRVQATPAHALVLVDGGTPDPTDPAAFIVPVGRSVVRAEAAGYAVRRVEVDVAAGEDLAVALVLGDGDGSSILASPWFWAAAVGAVLVTGAAVYLGVEGARCACVGADGKPCSC